MTVEGRINLLESKSQVYKHNFIKSTNNGDTEAAAMWKDGYYSIRKEISELKKD